jgi:diguanylate cyclase (GGDEF)-like protein/PAS domain S-box-containing protein
VDLAAHDRGLGGAGVTMHRLLRRQLELHLGPDRDRESAPELRRLLRDVEAEYRRADADRESLQRALELLGDLTRRQPVDRVRRAGAGASPLPRLLRRLFEQAPFAALVCDPDLEVLAWNPTAERLFGFKAADAVGRELATLLFPSDDRATVRRELRTLLDRSESDHSLRVATTVSGEARLDEWTVVPLRDREGRCAGAAVLVREPFASHDRYAVAWQGTGDVIWDWDLRKDRLWLSDAWLALLGTQAMGCGPTEWLDRVHASDRDAVQAAIRAHLDGQAPRFESEHRLQHEGGGWRWVLARGRAVRDGAGKAFRFCGSMMDVTERRAATERVLHDALHDPLTRLPNRALFLDLVKRSFARARRREGYGFAVMFLDLDRFKAVNDGLGHHAGDELLVQMARRLQTCLREGDTLARHGGDEFTILLDDVKGPADAQIVADRINQVTLEPFDVTGSEVFATTSIGIALSAPTYARPEDLLLDADTAMYRAKAQGRARAVVFDASMRERAPQLLGLEADLRHALVRDEFRVHYLPVVDVATGRIQGLEALIRWAHPKRGLITPEHFMPCAEETGLIVPMGRWLLGQAGRDFRSCRRASASGQLTLHVNLSSKQLLHSDLLEHIGGVVQEHHLDPKDLVVELTESTLQGEAAEFRMAELRDLGVRVFMDDFGTGYSSLNSLHRYQLDSLKIDRSLFKGGSPRGQSPELVRTIVAMAREMGKDVVAEGVETVEQFHFLRELGCSAAQGFYFSPPVDGDVARSLVERGTSW